MLVAKGMWLLVRCVPSVSKRRPFTYSHQVDIELGLQSLRSTPTNPEAVEHEEDIITSATSANQAGEVVSEHQPVSVQQPELQATLPTPVLPERSLSPAMVSRGRIDDNGLPTVHTENAQLALTDMERQGRVVSTSLRAQQESEV